VSVIGKTLKFSGGVLLGLGIGAVTALLLAPQSGEESTNQIRTRLDEALEARRLAQARTEDELQTRWEATVHEGGKDGAAANKPRKTPAQLAEERAQQKEEAARKDAEKHLKKASQELDKARTKI
jgi:gas vesicle protein